MNKAKQLKTSYKTAECRRMKAHCDTEMDNILMEDWCDIEPKNYVRKGTVNPQQCFALHHLITWMETGLNTTGEIKDPTTNVVMDNETVIELCGRHVYNGNDLPAVLGAYVMALIPDEVPQVPQAPQVQQVQQVQQAEFEERYMRIWNVINNNFETDYEEDFYREIAQSIAIIDPVLVEVVEIYTVLNEYMDMDVTTDEYMRPFLTELLDIFDLSSAGAGLPPPGI